MANDRLAGPAASVTVNAGPAPPSAPRMPQPGIDPEHYADTITQIQGTLNALYDGLQRAGVPVPRKSIWDKVLPVAAMLIATVLIYQQIKPTEPVLPTVPVVVKVDHAPPVPLSATPTVTAGPLIAATSEPVPALPPLPPEATPPTIKAPATAFAVAAVAYRDSLAGVLASEADAVKDRKDMPGALRRLRAAYTAYERAFLAAYQSPDTASQLRDAAESLAPNLHPEPRPDRGPDPTARP